MRVLTRLCTRQTALRGAACLTLGLAGRDTAKPRCSTLAPHGLRWEPSKELVFSESVLGTGATGSVHLARRQRDGLAVAVKVIDQEDARPASKSRLASAVREAEVHREMQHPHIVRLEEAHRYGDQVFLVMEALEGGELFESVVERGCFSEPEAQDALRQMLSALAYLHGRGLVHRDVKLENWVYEGTPGSSRLKLVDFGTAVRLEPGQQLLAPAGTLEYMAPEAAGHRGYTEQADLWSLGVLAYCLLCGEMPWESCEGAELRTLVARGRPDLDSEAFLALPQGAKEFLRRLLEADPAKRLTARQALDHPWLASAAH